MNSSKETFLSIIIPAYNEEKRIPLTLKKISEFLKTKDFLYEIIIIDDGSQDATSKIVEEFSKDKYNELRLIRLDKNYGKGFAVRKGVLCSAGKYVLVTDADLSTPIEELEKLLKVSEQGFDVVIGTRGLDKSLLKVHRPWYREKMGKIFNLLVQLFVIRGINDTQCGFKLFSRRAISIFKKNRIDDFSYDVEVLYIAKKYGYKIKEVPVIWIDSPYSKVKLYKDPFKMFISLLLIRINDAMGCYD